jgi:hypothetical protein
MGKAKRPKLAGASSITKWWERDLSMFIGGCNCIVTDMQGVFNDAGLQLTENAIPGCSII